MSSSSSDSSGPATPNGLIFGNSVLSILSFCFTFFTLLRLLWSSLETFAHAGTEIHLVLSNLKSALYEERELTRRAAHESHRIHGGRRIRQQARSSSGRRGDEVDAAWIVDARAARVFADTVKEICKQFKSIEAPFLRPDLDLGKGNEHFSGGREYGIAEFGGFQGDYEAVSIYHRFRWLRKKGQCIDLLDTLQRLQTRRIGLEVAGLQR